MAGRFSLISVWIVLAAPLPAAVLSGTVTGPEEKPLAGVTISVVKTPTVSRRAISDSSGRFSLNDLSAGTYHLTASSPGFAPATLTVRMQGASVIADVRMTALSTTRQEITVNAAIQPLTLQNPDPTQRVLVRSEILDANPGRPGAPVSIPGLPIETASGGIKAPQYFAPGVAGDHGEPIATFIQVGTFLLPNNLSANAHGNGYSDPNILVPSIIESVQTDGGAFNVLEGNHSVDLAETYGLRSQLQPTATLTADYRDVDLTAGWRWLATEASYGNGFLDRLEHRQQYKFNTINNWNKASHSITLLSIGYYGTSDVPGLVPINTPGLGDTIDSRQKDQTHTAEIAVNDVWRLNSLSHLQSSAFFRTYNLSLYSNFGDGLIRQSEFRTVTGGNSAYVRTVNNHFSFMTGLDYLRDAPRRDDLDHYTSTDPATYGPFQKVTANNITLNLVSPYLALDGNVVSWLHYDLGWRRGQIGFENADLLIPANSFNRWVGINSPKATLAILPPDSLSLPSIAFSFGQAFFTNDPRIGVGTQQGSLVSQSHTYQLVVSKTLFQTDFRVTLARETQEQSLAKIDPDTGLQFNEGPSRNRYVTVTARHYFANGLLQASLSKADARDLSDGLPVPEAPRLILDVLGTVDHLPFRLRARAEFEEVGRKPLGDGCVSVPVREFRAALLRTFLTGRLDAGLDFQIASGYTGQTTEVLALPGESEPSERVVGVYLPSYATVTISYHFGH